MSVPRRYRPLAVLLYAAFVGILLNGVAVVTNGGFMPVWEPSLLAAGLTPADVGSAFHKLVLA